jgi:hypothetical protein
MKAISITDDRVQRLITVERSDDRDLTDDEARAAVTHELRRQHGLVVHWTITSLQRKNYDKVIVTLEN